MEVVIPTMDFDFNSARSSPCMTAPSTPKRFGEYYFSVPTSPRRLSEFYHDFDDFSVTDSASEIPFDWEEKPGTPKSPPRGNTRNTWFEDDFAFDVGDESKKTTIPAEELFDHGKIRPLKPPPHLRGSEETPKSSPMSRIRGTLSPRKKKQDDPFATAVENTPKRTEQERGRERVSSFSSSSSGRRATRSVSPYRVSKYPWEEEEEQQQQQLQQKNTNHSSSIIPKPTLSSTNSTLSSSSSKGYRKWRLKDFFLFRSASEGRAADKDPLKYTALFKKHEDVKNSSFRSIEGGSKRRGQVSAHEVHYTANRAASEDLKKKTFLPYKQGILGRLSFNPAVHALANGFGFSRK